MFSKLPQKLQNTCLLVLDIYENTFFRLKKVKRVSFLTLSSKPLARGTHNLRLLVHHIPHGSSRKNPKFTKTLWFQRRYMPKSANFHFPRLFGSPCSTCLDGSFLLLIRLRLDRKGLRSLFLICFVYGPRQPYVSMVLQANEARQNTTVLENSRRRRL